MRPALAGATVLATLLPWALASADPPPDPGGFVIVHAYANYAWRPVASGCIVTETGKVFARPLSPPRKAPAAATTGLDPVWAAAGGDSDYTRLADLGPDDLAKLAALGPVLRRTRDGPRVSHHAASDSGETSLTAFVRPDGGGPPARIVLGQAGDFDVINKSPGASTALQMLAAMKIEGCALTLPRQAK